LVSLATTIDLIDTALLARYSGITIDINGTPTSVTPLIEHPHTEIKREKIYPSVVCRYINHMFDPSRAESSDDLMEEVSLDTGVTPYERIERKGPMPYVVLYSIHTWHKDRVIQDRELVKKVFNYKTSARGYLTVKNIDDEDINVDAIAMGDIVPADETLPDTVIYHKVQTLSILAYLSQEDADTTERQKVAMDVGWNFYQRKLLETPSGTVDVPGQKVLDISLSFDAIEEGPA